ncbi:TetR/AcrR family transcriptional regulator C-terminal domain-containing protein [Amycolatopsis anabasis]|uniref:TetR/AcrR family transcriptional regulator C-terminal domain-containing protein n=1 Tax=Amycolatopsis anabasis TaxID=1840409 RepID=UPI00131C40B8|nr:TetR/AcrR family transcriptional regulator C-terminal domain-containing protein [Amycolatopsis anabasis]
MADRRARPRAGLTRERVLDAALDFVDEHGIAALSMRKLGAALDVEAMTLYHYVPNKDALLDALVDRVVEPVAVPEPGDGWRTWLGGLARGLRTRMLEHPALLPLMATRPVRGREATARVETALGVLCAAGFDPPRALDTFNAVMTFVLGHTLAEAGRTPGHEESDVDSTGHLAEFPILAEALRTGPRHEERFELALEALLAGLG